VLWSRKRLKRLHIFQQEKIYPEFFLSAGKARALGVGRVACPARALIPEHRRQNLCRLLPPAGVACPAVVFGADGLGEDDGPFLRSCSTSTWSRAGKSMS
jgi:hypothetical protein